MSILKFLADENFNNAILDSITSRNPEIDVWRVQDIGLSEADDPTVLEAAAQYDRIVLSHDRSTMIDFAYKRIADNKKMPGLFIVKTHAPIGLTASEIIAAALASREVEWEGKVTFLPLK